jgi:hypothetical protein
MTFFFGEILGDLISILLILVFWGDGCVNLMLIDIIAALASFFSTSRAVFPIDYNMVHQEIGWI